MSLDNIYDKTDNARDNLVNAIRTMGVTVAEDSTINQCANAILMIPSGGSAKYYQCASVDTSTKTWTGYELVLENGKYTVSTTLTEELGYTSIIPVIDSYYTEDALAQMIPYMGWQAPAIGLVFYASLAGASDTAETGQALTTTGEVPYSTVNNIPCAYFNGSSDIHMESYQDNIPVEYSDRTVSVWVHANQAGWAWATGYGEAGPALPDTGYVGDILGITPSGNPTYSQKPDVIDNTIDVRNAWVHLCGVVSESKKILYVNGVLKASKAMESPTGNTYGIHIGSTCGYEFFTGYLSGVRIYNRALSADEITTLASEFTPTGT